MKLLGTLLAAGCAMTGFLLLRRPASYSLLDKVVVITGGSRGLGLALAREFARNRAKLALLARDREELERAATDLRSLGAEVTTWTCDVQREQDVAETISAIGGEYGHIDVLVNNAGIMLVAPLDLMVKEDFEEAMNVHFWAAYRVTMAALPLLKQSPPSRIVNISSIGGRVAVPHMAPYCASKFALAGFSDAIRAELARQGVHVTSVFPGLMRTGSHINAEFKGSHAMEYAWFSISAGLPFLSIDASRAARQIVEATRNGRPELTITLQARALILAQALAPNLFARALQLGNAFLPENPGGEAHSRRKGYHCQSDVSPSRLTQLADAASPLFNEEPKPE
jgi:NAD(P)-dependent dehydrogenase (short-subunit alcohol dehydrogenase family)